ncbi:uncharacterized protein LOC117654227 [Thrips palmi]|uniref:Uncharacterized protein LOC117654227 n=1 Tax=Thrips palmi TaxID=161013 RepID=A0A6P9ADU5_THRPL|nr:uncharacterized protein LOC117654227 [Thrips palmi]
MASLLTVPPWKRVLDRVMLALNVLSQAGLLVAFFAEVLRQSPDRASIALFFFTGFFLLHFGLWRRIGSADALRENLTPFLNVAQSIEDDALKDLYADGESPGQGLRRVRQLTPVLPKLIFMARWQAPLVSVVLTLLFEIGGRHIVPHWPNGQGRDLVEHCTVVLHISLIAYAGRVFLVTCAMQWMSSLCMDCCLRLLADRAARAPTWHQLAQTVRQHHNLLTGFNRIQKYFSEDLSLVVRLMLFLGLIGALRIAFGVQDINNMVIMGIVYSYVATICVAGELQARANPRGQPL